jgi:hypothetical protein
MKVYCSQGNCSANLEFSQATVVVYTCKDHTTKAPDDVRFQPYQFDNEMGSGTDPKIYEHVPNSKKAYNPGPRTGRPRKKRLKKIEESLAGHENADKIMNVLRKEDRGGNS